MALIYVRAVGSALAEGALTAAWVAAGELPVRQRRLARAGAIASVVSIGLAAGVRNAASITAPAATTAHPLAGADAPAGAALNGGAAPDDGAAPDGGAALDGGAAPDGDVADDRPEPMDPRRLAVTLVLGGLSIGMLVSRRHLEKRWLARLEANGHEHPHRALALRLGLLSVAATLPGRLRAARDAQRKSVDLDQG